MNPSILLAVFLLAAPCRAADLAVDPPFNLNAAPDDLKSKFSRLRTSVEGSGYRCNDDDGTIFSPRLKPGGPPEAHELAGTKEILEMLDDLDKGQTQAALGRIAQILKDQDPSKPLSPDRLALLQNVLAANKQFLAPNIVAGIEKAAAGPVGSLGADALAGYADLSRYFDGRTTAGALWANAQPVAVSWGGKPTAPSYFNNDERLLGERLKQALAVRLGESKTGREMLANFIGSDNVVHLPDMLVLKIDDFAAAMYAIPNRSVICNFGPVKEALVANAPLDQQRDLEARLKTPKDLNEYLAKHPGALEGFVKLYDVELFHELTHAWQDKRGLTGFEVNRGNLPVIDPLQWEWEAFRNQNRYLHEKLLADPDAALRSPWLDNYKQMLADASGWQDAITRQYLSSHPEQAATPPEFKELQNLRRRTAYQDALTSPKAFGKALLRGLGLTRGDEALVAEDADFAARSAKFNANELPGMRVDGFLALSAAYEKRLEYKLAFENAVAAENSAKGTPKAAHASERAQALSDKALAWVRAGKGDPDNLAGALSAVFNRYLAAQKPFPDDTATIFAVVYLNAADSHLHAAQGSNVSEIQTRQRIAAQSYVDALQKIKPAEISDPALRKRLVDARAAFGLDPEGKP